MNLKTPSPVLLFALVLSLQGCNMPLIQTDRPNVLLIMTDDQGWGDIAAHGNPDIDTPVLDKLATQGAQFQRFFVSPVCAPTRASLLTGKYHLKTGTMWVTRNLEAMRSQEVTIAEILRDAGYATGCFGKWHNGSYYPENATGQGFDEFFGFSAGHLNNYFNAELRHNDKIELTNGFISDVLTDKALAFIEDNTTTPFFCYLPYNAPHGPFQVPDTLFEKYQGRGLSGKHSAVYGMVESLDHNIGRLLDRLETLRIANNTIVIFLTDNGPNGQRYNGGMKGAKGSVDEGGVRVPLFIRWPGKIQPGTNISQLAAHIDLLPTILELTSVAKPKGVVPDGISLAPLLTYGADDWPDRMLFTHQNRGTELEKFPGAVRTSRYRAVNHGTRWELFDMLKDPGQSADISSDHVVLPQLAQAYDTWWDEIMMNPPERRPIPVGYPQAAEVELLAPDAYLEGGLKFHGNKGWANDWITSWNSEDCLAWWDLDVVNEGSFRVFLNYTCRAENVGSSVEIEIGNTRLLATIDDAYDPEFATSPDRAQRGEVYEKSWRQLEVGGFAIERGRTRLVVTSPTVAGGEVAELKSVTLKRI
jgi:arylsulfatase A